MRGLLISYMGVFTVTCIVDSHFAIRYMHSILQELYCYVFLNLVVPAESFIMFELFSNGICALSILISL